MQIIIDKIGKINHADIAVNGLTVIAGKNDTGKSTVGKILYAVIQAIKTYKTFYDNNQLRVIAYDLLLPLLQQYVGLPIKNDFSKEASEIIESIRDPFFAKKSKQLTKENILFWSSQLELNTNTADFSDGMQKKIKEIRQRIRDLNSASEGVKFFPALNNQLQNMFAKVINNSKYREKASICVNNKDIQILSADIENDTVTHGKFDYLRASGIFGNVFYIETPFVLENVLAVEKPNWLDTFSLLNHKRRERKEMEYISLNSLLLSFIQQHIFKQSKFALDSEKAKFYYQVDQNSVKLPPVDMACGMKSFALLFTLLNMDLLTKDALLILDEPENHLHPEWQIKYAELVCLLVSKGFSVVLASHSPTFIQALVAYSRKYSIKDKTSFYLAEQMGAENYSSFADVSDNIDRISENLVEPMDKLFLGV